MSDPVILSLKYTAEQQNTIDVNHLLALADYVRGDFLDHEPDSHEILLSNFIKLDYVYPVAYFEVFSRNVSGAKEKPLRKVIKRAQDTEFGVNGISKYPLVICPIVKAVIAIDSRKSSEKYQVIYAGRGERLRVKYLTIRGPGIYENGVWVVNDYLAGLSGKLFDCLDKELIINLFNSLRVVDRYAGTFGAVERSRIIYDNSKLLELHKNSLVNLTSATWTGEKLLTIPEMNYLSDMDIHADQSPIGLASLYSTLDSEHMLLPFLRGDIEQLQNYLFRLKSNDLNRRISNSQIEANIKFGSYVRICKKLGIAYDDRARNTIELVNSVMVVNPVEGRKNLSALEYHYNLERAEIEIAKNNLCSHIIGLRKLKLRPDLWEPYKKRYLGEKQESYYLCAECGVPILCPHMVDFFEGRPISKYYENTTEDSGVYVCKICREILVDGTAGVEATVVNGYDRELDDLIWKDLQAVKRCVNFRRVSDLRGQNRFLDRAVIDKLYPILYEINMQLSRLKSMTKAMINNRQSFYNQAHILLYFIRTEYEVSLTGDYRRPDYKLKDRISMMDIVRYLSMTNKDALQFMNFGEAQVQAMVTDAGKNILKLVYGTDTFVINHVMITINILPILKLVLGGSFAYSGQIMTAWTDSECRRVFGFPLSDMNHRNYLEPILKLDSDEEFSRMLQNFSIVDRPWLRWARTSVLNAIDVNSRVRDAMTLDFEKLYPIYIRDLSMGLKYTPDGPVRDPTISDSEIAEYAAAREPPREFHKFTDWIFEPWYNYKSALVNLLIEFDKNGMRRKWTKIVYADGDKEIILSNSDWDKRPSSSVIIDTVDSTGARRSELLEEPFNLSRDWNATISNGIPTKGFASEVSSEIYNEMNKKLMKIDFIQHELIKAEHEGRVPDMAELISSKYFAKHYKEFNKSRAKVSDSKDFGKLSVYSRPILKYDEDRGEKLEGLIAKLSADFLIHHSYLWELGNLRGRQYRDIPDEWTMDSGNDIAFEGVSPARRPQNRYSSYRMSMIRSYYLMIVQTLETFKHSPQKIIKSLIYEIDLKTAVSLGESVEELPADDLKYMDPFLLDSIEECQKQVVGAMYVLYSRISELRKKNQKIIDPLFAYILGLDANNCAPDIRAGVVLSGFLKIQDDELEADASLESVESGIDDDAGNSAPDMGYFDFFVEEGLEVNLEP